MMEAAVSAAAGGACAGGAALLYCAEKLPGINRVTNRLHTDRAQAGLILTAFSAMVATPPGRWWHHLVDSANGWLVSMIGAWMGLVVTGIPALLVALYLVNDLVTRRVEMRTRVLAALLPVLAVTVPGPIGSGLQAVLSWIVTTIGHLVAAAFGLG